MNRLQSFIARIFKIEPARDRTVTIIEPHTFRENVLRNKIWYRGDSAELEQYFQKTARWDVEKARFWAAHAQGNVRKMHSGIVGTVVDRYKDIVLADMDSIDFGENQKSLNELWNKLYEKSKLNDVIGEAITGTLAAGDGAFKITADSCSEYPIVEFYDAENVDYVYVHSKLQEIKFYTTYKNGKKDLRLEETYGHGYADMAIRTASKRAYLQGEGEMRQQWGLHLVIMNKRGSPCPKCLPFVGKILIDDVWSGGSSKDGKYPLMSSAIAAGLYHPRCKDSHTTYFPGITKVDPKYNKQEIADIEDTAKQEAKQQYAERQEKRFGRLADFSLNPENQKQYEQMQNRWKHVRMRTGKVSSQEYAESKRPLADFHAASQNQVVSLLRTESQEWIDSLSEKEKYAIEKYTFNSGDQKPNRFFERLNAMLRGDIAEDKKLRGYAETISGALKKSKIEHDVIAYRNLDIPLYNEFEVNDLVTENQFISTSVVQSAALDKAYKVLIYVPKGSCCAYIEKISKYPKQRELLLDKNTIFRVISKKKNSIELQVIV